MFSLLCFRLAQDLKYECGELVCARNGGLVKDVKEGFVYGKLPEFPRAVRLWRRILFL